MGRIDDLISSLARVEKTLSNGEIMRRAFMRDKDTIEPLMCDMQREQLMKGKRADGNNIVPSYFEDPYFQERKSARRYANYKAKVFGTAERHYSSPNLYISGYFYNGFYVDFRADEISMENSNRVVSGRNGHSQDLYAKYGKDTFGLSDGNWDIVLERIRPEMIDCIKETIQEAL